MWRADSLGKTLMLRTIEGRRRRGRQRVRWLDSISNSMDMSLSKLQEIEEDRGAWRAADHGSQRAGHDWVTKQRQQPTLPWQTLVKYLVSWIHSPIRSDLVLADIPYSCIHPFICPNSMWMPRIGQAGSSLTEHTGTLQPISWKVTFSIQASVRGTFFQVQDIEHATGSQDKNLATTRWMWPTPWCPYLSRWNVTPSRRTPGADRLSGRWVRALKGSAQPTQEEARYAYHRRGQNEDKPAT